MHLRGELLARLPNPMHITHCPHRQGKLLHVERPPTSLPGPPPSQQLLQALQQADLRDRDGVSGRGAKVCASVSIQMQLVCIIMKSSVVFSFYLVLFHRHIGAPCP